MQMQQDKIKKENFMSEEEFKTITTLIDDTYKNVRMGSFGIDCIIDKIEDGRLEELMRKQNAFYLDATTDLERISEKYKHEPVDIGPFLKGSSFTSINMKTMFNKETQHIAEMLIQGTTMGITETIKSQKDNPVDDKELTDLVLSVISHQEDFVESLKEFL